MFEKFMEKFSKREEPDVMEFKRFEDIDDKDDPIIDEYDQVTTQEATHMSDNVELKVIRPEAYEEVSNVADSLLEGCTVVLNLEALERHAMLRMLDFLNGVTYCTNGEIKKVAPSTFIITPHSNIDISDM